MTTTIKIENIGIEESKLISTLADILKTDKTMLSFLKDLISQDIEVLDTRTKEEKDRYK